MPSSPTPTFTVTQSKLGFVLSLITLACIVYAGTSKLVRYQIEFDELKESYAQLAAGQKELRDEVKSLRDTVDDEIRHMAQAVNRLSSTLEEQSNGGSK